MKSSTFAALSQDSLGEQTSRPFAGTSRSRPMPRDVTRKPDFLVTYSESGLRAEQTQGPPETSGAHPRPPPSTRGSLCGMTRAHAETTQEQGARRQAAITPGGGVLKQQESVWMRIIY